MGFSVIIIMDQVTVLHDFVFLGLAISPFRFLMMNLCVDLSSCFYIFPLNWKAGTIIYFFVKPCHN